jgi:hypothetical protein
MRRRTDLVLRTGRRHFRTVLADVDVDLRAQPDLAGDVDARLDGEADAGDDAAACLRVSRLSMFGPMPWVERSMEWPVRWMKYSP